MQVFFDTAPPPPSEAETACVMRIYPQYAEVLWEIPPDSTGDWYSSYLTNVEDEVMAAMTCWDQHWDATMAQFADPETGQNLAREFRKIWPTFFWLLDNTMDGRYGDGAFAEVVDPDDQNRKWVIARLVGISGVSDDDMNDRLLDAAESVTKLSIDVLVESHKQLSMGQKAKLLARGAASGYVRGRQTTAPWENRLGWLQAMLGQ